MSYEKEFETTPPQNNPKLLQDLAQIPPQAYGVAAVLGFTVFGIIPWYIAFAGIILGWAMLNSVERKHALELAKARASSFANCIGPVIISAISPLETLEEMQVRAQDWRQKLRESGNHYADLIPIITFPYTPALTAHGSLSMSWSMYTAHVGQQQYEENIRWHLGKCPSELKSRFAADVLPAPRREEIEN